MWALCLSLLPLAFAAAVLVEPSPASADDVPFVSAPFERGNRSGGGAV